MTRRVVKPQPDRYFEVNESPFYLYDVEFGKGIIKPAHQPGDVLYVRETWFEYKGKYYYRSDGFHKNLDAVFGKPFFKWRPSIHMPRAAARLFAVVKDVRVERLQSITPEDCELEGMDAYCDDGVHDPGDAMYVQFRNLWDSLTAKQPERQWQANPYVWAYGLMRTEGVRLP